MGTDKILLHFNSLPQQNVTQFSQNPLIHQKRQNEVLRGNMNMNVSPKSGNYAIGRTPIYLSKYWFKVINDTNGAVDRKYLIPESKSFCSEGLLRAW